MTEHGYVQLLAGLGLAVALAGTAPVLLGSSGSSPAPLLFDYRDLASFGTQPPIEPAGYFEIGRRYVHSPRVEWKPVPQADYYRLLLVQKDRVLGVTRATNSPAFLEAGWRQARLGNAAVVIEAYAKTGRRIALSRLFPFEIAPDFQPRQAPKPRCSFRDSALAAFAAIDGYQPPASVQLPTDGAPAGIKPAILAACNTPTSMARVAFPNLHDWLYMDLCEALMPLVDDPALRQRIKTLARSVGSHLLMSRLPVEGNAYGGMVRGAVNWRGESALGLGGLDSGARAKYSRLVEPAKCGYSAEALLKLHEMLGDEAFLRAALQMADIFDKTQAPDGSWPARVDGQTGEVLAAYSTSVAAVVSFLDRLQRSHPDPRWAPMRDRALDWLQHFPIRTYGWVVNFDDNPASADKVNPYVGLSNWDLFCFTRYAAAEPRRLPDTVSVLREQLAWNDNHFVFYGADPLLPFEPWYPCCAEQGNPGSFSSPGGCWVPMDFHTANWGRALLAMYRLTGERVWLDKAKAAAAVLQQYQLGDGRTITWMQDRYLGLSAQINGAASQDFWPAGWAASGVFWAELAALERGKSPHSEGSPGRQTASGQVRGSGLHCAGNWLGNFSP
jgi:hypothetical protein